MPYTASTPPPPGGGGGWLTSPGQLRARDVGHSKLCKPPVFSSLWSRESEVNNVCWKCPHHFNSDPRQVDCKRSRSLVGERFSMLQRKPLTDKLFWQPIADWSAIIDNHLPTTEFLRKAPKKVVVGGRREVVDVIIWQPIADWSAIIDKHLPTSDNLRQGRRLVVAIVWLWL